MNSTRNRLIVASLLGLAVFVVAAWCGHPLAGLTAGTLVPILGTAQTDADLVRQLIAWGMADAAAGLKKLRINAQTGNYQVLSPLTAAGDPSGTIFTNRGAAGAVTFTLPVISAAMAGVYYDFVGFANQTWAVAAAAATVCTFNNAAATSVTCSTAGAKIGAHIRAYCDGTSWHVNGDTVGVTYTVA